MHFEILEWGQGIQVFSKYRDFFNPVFVSHFSTGLALKVTEFTVYLRWQGVQSWSASGSTGGPRHSCRLALLGLLTVRYC